MSHFPPRDSTFETEEGVLDGFREVATTLWPSLRARRASSKPKPEEQPVMNQTGGSETISVDFAIFYD